MASERIKNNNQKYEVSVCLGVSEPHFIKITPGLDLRARDESLAQKIYYGGEREAQITPNTKTCVFHKVNLHFG